MTARLIRPAGANLDTPDLAILGQTIVAYVLATPEHDDLSLSWTLDTEDAVLALFVFLREAMPNEIAEALAEGGQDSDLPDAIGALGLPARFDRTEIEDRFEADLTLYGSDLVLGVQVTSTSPEATAAALDFAILRILPQFLETP